MCENCCFIRLIEDNLFLLCTYSITVLTLKFSRDCTRTGDITARSYGAFISAKHSAEQLT